MNKKKNSSLDQHSENPSKKHEADDPDKRYPSPDDPNEEMGPPIKEMPIKAGLQHPHEEEILDRTPE